MIKRLAILFSLTFLLVAAPARAAFHLWVITEVFSNADGTVQFIELTATSGGQQFLAGHTITSSSGGQTKTLNFATNLPGDTAGRTFLIGTQAFATAAGVTPDYVMPSNFLFLNNGSLNFGEFSDLFNYNTLPTTGNQSLNINVNTRAVTTAAATPKNFGGTTGTIVVGAPNYSDLYWVGEIENGWGMSIQQHGNVQFNALYVYDDNGLPTWYVMPGCTWNQAFTVCNGQLYQPVSAPLNNYNPASFVVGAAKGTITLTFTSLSRVTVQYTINGVAGTKNMERQVFGFGTSPLQVGDMWYGGAAQDGWGVTLVQQQGIVFAVWYTYGMDGKATWFVLPTGVWTGTTYAGKFYATNGPRWLGATFNPAQLVVTEVGNMSFAFSNANAANMTYTFTGGPFAGTTQTKALIRQPY